MLSTDSGLIHFSSRTRVQSSKPIKKRDEVRHQISERIIHHPNEMSPDEIRVHDCLVMDEFRRRNPDLKLNISKHERMKEALESQEVRRTIVNAGLVFTGTPGYNWDLGTTRSTPHPLSIVPINSEFHNAELAYIAIKSHKRSAYDLQRARGKRRPIIIIYLRFNPSPIFSTNGFPFLNIYSYRFYSTIESNIHQEVQISN